MWKYDHICRITGKATNMTTTTKKKLNKLGVKLGRNIFERRKSLGWTQAELAEKIEVDTETISRFERGSNLPSLSRLDKLANVMNFPLSKLIAESSSHAGDQAEIITEWISELGSDDREFVMDSVKQLCAYLARLKRK
jgi:transcriptional regulator with XRE-family HTH domain